jgi:hypothetical protein
LLLCEDGGGEQFLRGVTLDGRIFDFAKNLQNDFEWAGATFAEADLNGTTGRFAAIIIRSADAGIASRSSSIVRARLLAPIPRLQGPKG